MKLSNIHYPFICFAIVVLVGLGLISRENYLLFHTIAESFSIVVACCIFVVAWNCRRSEEDGYLLLLGVAYLFVAALDGLHTLAYNGMGVFQAGGSNLATQLWILARYLESFSLLAASLLVGRRLRGDYVFAGYAAVSAALLLSVFTWPVFPTCYIEEAGLTTFKKVSESVIVLLLLVSGGLFLRRRRYFKPGVLNLLIASVAVTCVSELVFTAYRDVTGFANLAGHYLKIVSFYLIYRAVVQTALVQPVEVLFRDLKHREEALRDARDEWERTFDAVPDCIFILDNKSRIVQVNKVVADRLGCSTEDILGRHCYDVIHGRDDYTDDCPHLQMLVDGREHKVELYEERLGGWYSVSVTPLRDTNGEIVGAVHVGRDITERKHFEDVLQTEKEFTESALNAQTDTLFIFEPETGRAVRWNDTFRKLSGYSDEEIRSMKAPDSYYGPDDLKKAAESVERIFTEGAVTVEMSLVTKDGRSIPMEYTGSAITDDRGNLRYIIAAGRDITERKLTEQALRQSEARFRTLVEGLGQGYVVFMHDREGIVTYVSPSIEAIAGVKPEQIIGRHWQQYAKWTQQGIEAGTEWGRRIRETGQDSEPFYASYEFQGKIRYLEIAERATRDDAGNIVGIEGIAKDVTEQVLATRALQEARDELEQRVQQRTAELQRRLVFERLMFHLSERFVDLAGEEIEEEVTAALKDVVEFFGVDRGSIFLVSEDRTRMLLLHSYRTEGTDLVSEVDAATLFPCIWPRFLDGQTLSFSSVDELPDEAAVDRESFKKFGAKSQVAVPVSIIGGSPTYVFSIGSVRQQRVWDEDLIPRIQLVGELLTGALRRKEAERRLMETELLSGTILASLDDHVAVLDREGRLISVNDAWTQFAEQNGAPSAKRVSVGVNYLDVCRRAIRNGEPTAEAVLAGIEAVMNGQRDEFSMEYECSSPAEQRCFLLTVLPLKSAAGGAVVSHTNVTRRKMAEEALRQTHERLESRVRERTAELQALNAKLEREIADREQAEQETTRLARFPSENPNPVLRVADDGTILYANTAGSIILDTWKRQVGERLPHPTLQLVKEVADSGEIHNYEFNCDNGAILFLTLAPVAQEGYLNVYGTDVTKRHQIEEDLRRTRDELELRVRERTAELARSREALRTLAGRLLHAQEEQRRRLARELHDDLTQRLAVLAIDISVVAGQIPTGCDSIREKLESVRSETVRLSTDVHAISRQLHPSILDDLGLIDAIRSECSTQSERGGVKISFESSKLEHEVPRDVAICFYRVLQETLRNAAKYARAGMVSVSVSEEAGRLVLRVEDDGVGFDVEGARHKVGLGLASMEERVRLVNGEFCLESSPGRGTTVIASAALPKEKR